MISGIEETKQTRRLKAARRTIMGRKRIDTEFRLGGYNVVLHFSRNRRTISCWAGRSSLGRKRRPPPSCKQSLLVGSGGYGSAAHCRLRRRGNHIAPCPPVRSRI